MIAPRVASRSEARTWFGQPRGLTILFLTEMWEKFSFYGMRAILVYYMTKALMLPQQKASLVYGAYTAGIYLTPIAGGVISDRWLGRRRSVILGGLVMACGHLMMASPALFYPALVTIALGNGLFLPSLPSQISSLYGEGDPRRITAYNIYYVGINVGGFLAPLVCGTLGEALGWHWGFTAAAVGMTLGLGIFLAGRRVLPADPPRRETRQALPARGRVRDRFALLLSIAGAVVVFRGAYEQLGNTVALWADSGVDRGLSPGLAIPMTWFQSLNPLLVFVFTPPLIRAWNRTSAGGRERASLHRMATGAGIVALSYLLLAWTARMAAGGPAHWAWFVLFFVVITLGELYILPVGLGLFGRLAPRGLEATTIATWYFAGFAGNLLAGLLGSFWSNLGHDRFFVLMAAVAAGSAVILLLLEKSATAVERAVADASGQPVVAG